MASKNEAERLLRSGLYPSQIASEMGISVGSVIQYLQTRVGEGVLRLSDIYLSFPVDKRSFLQKALYEARTTGYVDSRSLQQNGITKEEADLFKKLQQRRVFAGDIYEYICDIEMKLHQLIKQELCSKFGDQEEGWWRQGISENIRTKCATRREQDDPPYGSPFAYTDLIDLSKIISDNWRLFQDHLPHDYCVNRKVLEADFVRLNKIRNAVMHPVKERDWSEDDFQFVKNVLDRFLKGAAT